MLYVYYMLRIKVFTYCGDFQVMFKIKVQKSKSNYLYNNNNKTISSKLKILWNRIKQQNLANDI